MEVPLLKSEVEAVARLSDVHCLHCFGDESGKENEPLHLVQCQRFE